MLFQFEYWLLCVCLFPLYSFSAECDISSPEAVQSSLVNHSPFIGTIEKRGKIKPMKLAFQDFGDQNFAIGNIGNISRDSLGDRELRAKYKSGGAIVLKGRTIGTLKTSKLKLKLDEKCQLSGSKLMLKSSELKSSVSKIQSVTDFSDYLVSVGRFSGKWRWTGLSNDLKYKFRQSEGDLVVDLAITTSAGVYYEKNDIPVWLLSAGLMRLPFKLSTHNAISGPMRLWRNEDGSLGGVSYSVPVQYKLKLMVYPE